MVDPRLARYRGPCLAFAAYLLLQAASAAALFVLKLGGGADGVRSFYLGSPERFTVAKTLPGVLEVAVPHLAAVPLVLFAAIHVVGFARAVPRRMFSALAALSFGSALVGIGSGFAVRWISPALAGLKVLAFAGLEVGLAAWALLLLVLFLPRRRAVPAPDARSAAQEAVS